jgi:tartrate dehydrogenase/decarboxylase / D-malate dehydrogenase
MTGRAHTVDVIAGDGIGPEVMAAAVACVDAVAPSLGFTMSWRTREWGSDHFRKHGRMMPVDGLDQMATGDAILLGAVGDVDIPDDVTLWGLLIPIRREFEQYVNLRPVRLLPGVVSPLAGVSHLDIMVVRENVEGEYSEVGGRLYRGQPEEMAVQESIFTRTGVERVATYAAELAQRRQGRLISATKSNGIIHTMPFWDEVVQSCVDATPGVAVESVLIDALAARMVLKPGSIDVVVASNLFGDILSDLAAAAAGSIGVAPSANLNPPRRHPSMFEPVHGSAPDIAGKGIANPIGQIWSAAMMLEHLGEDVAAGVLIESIEAALEEGIRTPDLGGTATTDEVADAVVRHEARILGAGLPSGWVLTKS